MVCPGRRAIKPELVTIFILLKYADTAAYCDTLRKIENNNMTENLIKFFVVKLSQKLQALCNYSTIRLL